MLPEFSYLLDRCDPGGDRTLDLALRRGTPLLVSGAGTRRRNPLGHGACHVSDVMLEATRVEVGVVSSLNKHSAITTLSVYMQLTTGGRRHTAGNALYRYSEDKGSLGGLIQLTCAGLRPNESRQRNGEPPLLQRHLKECDARPNTARRLTHFEAQGEKTAQLCQQPSAQVTPREPPD